MKKFLVLFTVLALVFALATVSYATQPEIEEEQTPASAVYDEPELEVEDEGTPAGTPDTTSQREVEVGEEKTPASNKLAETGGVAAEVFYAAGGLFIVAAGVLAFAKKK